MTSHLLFLGFSLTDKAYLSAAAAVAKIREQSGRTDEKVATALSLNELARDERALGPEFQYLNFAAPGREPAAAARALEVFLDRVAWRCSRAGTAGFGLLLDDRYQELVDERGGSELRHVLQQACRVAKAGASPWNDAFLRVVES